ncbi:ribonuclease H2 subunit B [Plasmodium gonderi]|uniref:Ribonuclease H2 subunit B n=1 Tax=Plasmodium gonderi TaxID=77519 RepID=A0A1Y1JN57_PLAGO|nr:ribonuclease H2 subunit B [Plasmodium gonderi]GAW82885.1 ribonuclease H2 subunit B [Plasmodium gonderi]
MDEGKNAFLFHLFCSNANDQTMEEESKIRNYRFLKLPSISEPCKLVLYYFNDKSNELYLLERNYYNPKIESIKHENDKINKSCVSLFINNYTIQNECCFFCYPIDVIFLFTTLIYQNCTSNTYTTLGDYIDNILRNNDIKLKNEIKKNIFYILNKNINNVKDRLKNVCDELYEMGKFYYKPNLKKVKNFYNFKCVILFNYIIENKIVFSDYMQQMDKEILEKYKINLNLHSISTTKMKNMNLKQIDKYNEYKKNVDSYVIHFNKKYYKFCGSDLRTFVWLIMKGFMSLSLSEKITPPDIHEKLSKMKEDDKMKKMQQNETFTKGKKHPLQPPRNQMMIESFFKRKKTN